MNNDKVELMFLRVLNHSLEVLSIISGCTLGFIDVFTDKFKILFVTKIFDGKELSFYRISISLVFGRESAIGNCSYSFFSDSFFSCSSFSCLDFSPIFIIKTGRIANPGRQQTNTIKNHNILVSSFIRFINIIYY